MSFANLWTKHQYILKNLIFIKIIILTVFTLYYSKILYFDEKGLTAADDSEKSEQAQASETGSDRSETVTKEESDSEESSGEEEPQGSESQPNEKSSRRTFLEGLLDLPALDKDKIKKDELGKYINLAEQKLQQVEVRLSVLKEQEEDLLEIEKRVEEKIRNLEEERRYYGETIQKEKDLKGERLNKLLVLYKKMEPKKAAQIFETLDRDLVVSLVKELPEKQTMKIMELMSPEKSTQLSEYFGRVRSGKEYELLKEINTSLVKEFEVCKGYKGE